MFNIYQELIFKELVNLKKDVEDTVNNFEILVLNFKSFCDDVFLNILFTINIIQLITVKNNFFKIC